MENNPLLSVLFPQSSRVLLTGTGKQFIERIGVETARQVLLGVMMGENIRTKTEPLTRQRVAQTSGAMVALFARGWLSMNDFTERVSGMAAEQMRSSRKNDAVAIWPAQWIIGLTGKAVQNVLRSDPAKMDAYVADFEKAVEQAADKCRSELGDLRMTLGFVEDTRGKRVELGWKDITRLTTAIGCQTLTIRGSDKSLYGKLFERLVLGSLLTMLGFERVNRTGNRNTDKVFWLSDSSGARESDATVVFSKGKLARFDIGFIGPGNPEISKDKLTRYTQEAVAASGHPSVTFIVVDRLPETSKTKKLAREIKAEIVQMSMAFWPREVAQRLGTRFGFTHPIQNMADKDIQTYLAERLNPIPIQDFLSGVSVAELADDDESPVLFDEDDDLLDTE